MDMVIHTSDFAGSVRGFPTVKKGVYYLFEEFFA